MRKFTGLAVLSLAVALFAQEAAEEHENVVQIDEQVVETPAPVVMQPAPQVEALPVVAEKKEEKKSDFPKFKQSGGISLTPRMEITGQKDAKGDKIEDIKDGVSKFNANRRRLMFGWAYKLNVAVNEKLELGFRLSDPSAEAGIEIGGSGGNNTSPITYDSMKKMLGVMLPNAYFTWKPADVFNLSGGLVNVPSNTALDLATLVVDKDVTKNFANTYWNSLAGFDFSLPFSPTVKVFLTAGIADYTHHNDKPAYAVDGKDTTIVKSYSDGRIILGADLSLADKKVSLKPAVQILTRHDSYVAAVKADTTKTPPVEASPASINDAQKPIFAEGIDMGFKFSSNFALNAGFGLAHDNIEKASKSTLINVALEPRLNFGGEKGKLFDLRAKYGLYTYNTKGYDGNDYKKVDGFVGTAVHHIDARFGIAVNEKLSIVPRYRLWAGGVDAGNWLGMKAEKVGNDDNKAGRSLSRLELGFAASF